MSPNQRKKISGHLKRFPGPLREATKGGAGRHGGSSRERHRRERREARRAAEREMLEWDDE